MNDNANVSTRSIKREAQNGAVRLQQVCGFTSALLQIRRGEEFTFEDKFEIANGKRGGKKCRATCRQATMTIDFGNGETAVLHIEEKSSVPIAEVDRHGPVKSGTYSSNVRTPATARQEQHIACVTAAARFCRSCISALAGAASHTGHQRARIEEVCSRNGL
ncbi:uncharacterized protein PAN0_003c1953 [Moesziomyces antarcticus]|uniref:uncharacterized protein n=1 Tax=Pseudozyma antarctica TaxID=84753 RepID=UPI0007197B5F|nr:uncharacterized protein PAN0_003c1953 [Moesziomyces antarcticus]GAK63745.1 hypothetical protein PAN0_003c1953 [Moesziomyces antarcticus]